MKFCLWGWWPPRWPVAWLLICCAAAATARAYDPLDIGNLPPPAVTDLVVDDTVRHRDIPVRVYRLRQLEPRNPNHHRVIPALSTAF